MIKSIEEKKQEKELLDLKKIVSIEQQKNRKLMLEINRQKQRIQDLQEENEHLKYKKR